MTVLGLGLSTASGVLVQGIRKANDTITGASTERIHSDHADWSVELSQRGSSQLASYADLPAPVQKREGGRGPVASAAERIGSSACSPVDSPKGSFSAVISPTTP